MDKKWQNVSNCTAKGTWFSLFDFLFGRLTVIGHDPLIVPYKRNDNPNWLSLVKKRRSFKFHNEKTYINLERAREKSFSLRTSSLFPNSQFVLYYLERERERMKCIITQLYINGISIENYLLIVQFKYKIGRKLELI